MNLRLSTRVVQDWIVAARAIACVAHEGQYRNDGNTPYIRHPEAVAALVEDYLKPIAWLHDVLEDTQIIDAQLQAVGFPEYVLRAVRLLTRTSAPYSDYIQQIISSGNTDAIKVKLADMEHNFNDSPSAAGRAKILRYRPKLEAALTP